MANFSSLIKTRLDSAMGRIPCDTLYRNARVLDVFSGKWRNTDIAIAGGWIVGLDRGYQGKEEIDLGGRAVVPGFIDAHVHLESSCMIPGSFERSVLPCGTTTAISDPHELANVQGLPGIQYFLEASEKTRLNLFVMMSSCVPATQLETNGGGALSAKDLLSIAGHRNALGLAEVMNVPGVLNGDPEILEKLAAFNGRPVDGHAPLVRGQALSAYACAGITSCHESSEREEAEEKMAKGIAVWIREGSVAKDLHELAPLLTQYSSAAMGFCTDDRNPLDIANEGHVDHLVRTSLKMGIPMEAVYRAASHTVARHYGLDRLQPNRSFRLGALAPGYQADFVVLDDAATCAISFVVKAGVNVRALEFAPLAAGNHTNTIHASAPAEEDLRGATGPVHVMKVIPGKIITDRYVADAGSPELAHLSVLERYGHGRKPANAYVSGFGEKFRGAIASSVGHDSHNLIAVGKDPKDMKVAMAHLIKTGGGFCVVDQGKVIADLPLPIGGLMSDRTAAELTVALKKLREASHSVGCELEEPFLQLAFLSLPVIPSLKLTDQGLVDVTQFRFIDVRAS
jgi:adenine deaminase